MDFTFHEYKKQNKKAGKIKENAGDFQHSLFIGKRSLNGPFLSIHSYFKTCMEDLF